MHQPNLGPLIIGVEGLQLNEADLRRLLSSKVGGVILFSRNYQSPTQLQGLTSEIHALRSPALPIFVDHEGGRVQRFKDGFFHIPAMGLIGQVYVKNQQKGLKLALAAGFVLASELRACGVDVSFTPVLDLDYGRSVVIGDRSFSSDPEIVSNIARALLHGLQLAGMHGCGKHFPGHGWAHADSHFEQPVDERSLEDILASDAAPYKNLGSLTLAAIMPAHVVYPSVDALPAGFSKIWLQNILRNQFDYQGLIVSDDLDMVGAHGAGNIVARAQAALEAGCDALLLCNDFANMDVVINSSVQHLNHKSAQRLHQLVPQKPPLSFQQLSEHSEYLMALETIKNAIE